MKNKYISFSMWGPKKAYTWGCLENALLAQQLFPDWTCRVYYGQDVESQVLEKLGELDNVELIDKSTEVSNRRNAMWRFLPLFEDEAGIVISRDTDSLLSPRDVYCVKEWLSSDKDFHIIRDAGEHTQFPIMAGLFGARNGVCRFQKAAFMDTYNSADLSKYNYELDQNFLARFIYPGGNGCLTMQDIALHAGSPAWKRGEKNSKEPAPLPTPPLSMAWRPPEVMGGKILWGTHSFSKIPELYGWNVGDAGLIQ